MIGMAACEANDALCCQVEAATTRSLELLERRDR